MAKNEVRVKAGRKSRRKGSSNERALAKIFEKWWGNGVFARTPASGGWATPAVREGFRTCGDIITNSVDFPFVLEAKKQEGWTLDQLVHNQKCLVMSWWKQTVDETPPGKVPLLIASRNHIPQAAIFSESDVQKLVKANEYAWKDQPCLPWEQFQHMTYTLGTNGAMDDPTTWVIMSLDNFFKISPDCFGRRFVDATREEGRDETSTDGPA